MIDGRNLFVKEGELVASRDVGTRVATRLSGGYLTAVSPDGSMGAVINKNTGAEQWWPSEDIIVLPVQSEQEKVHDLDRVGVETNTALLAQIKYWHYRGAPLDMILTEVVKAIAKENHELKKELTGFKNRCAYPKKF